MEFREITERYRLEKILKSARGGTVLRAIDAESGRTVVVKLIPVGSAPNLEARMAAFGRMAAAIGALGHPALPVVLDSGITPDGSAFLVLEHLEGGRGLDTLAGVAPTRAIPLLMQVVSGLEALAGQRLTYLNLSSDNVLVIPGPAGDPVGEQAKLLGLGTVLFQPVGGAGDEARRFRAPELLSPLPGERADARADLYSLAVTSCHVLGATITAGAPEPGIQMPLALSFELENAEALRQVLERCLRRRPAERPSHQAVRYAFQLALDGSESSLWQPAAPVPAAVPQPKPVVTPVAAPVATPVETPAPAPRETALPPLPPLPPLPTLPPPVAAPPPPAVPPPVSVMAAAAPVAAAAPLAAAPLVPGVAAPPEPEPEGEVLSTVDDELLEALAPTPPPAPVVPPGKAAKPAGGGRVIPFLRRAKTAPPPVAAEGSAAAADGAGPAVPARSRRPLLLGVAAALLLIAAVAVLWMMLREPATVSAPAPVVVAAAPPRPPQRPATERLEEARLLLAQGEDDQARQILRSLTAADEASLPPSACRVLDGLRETLLLASRDRLPGDLAAGLETGNLARLRSAVETGTEQPDLVAVLPAEAQADFGRARQVVDLYTQAETAARDARHPAVLERFAALLALVPELVDPLELRKKSADVLETEAEKLVAAGRYPEALAKLEPLRRTWPDRLGLTARIAGYEGYQKDEAEQKRILEALPAVERRRKPHEGLEALAAVKPTPHLAPQFAQARGRLENLLAQLDRQPPKVVLREGYTLTYPRGAVVTLSFRATDDYEVKDVKLMLRPPGGKMRSMAMEETRMGHTIEIPPSLHQNGTVELYVTATDRSGHEGSFGTAAQPMQLTRQQGFERIVR